ncbi:MAG: alcohol dehydrogenase catalytic domain-containing protein [Planctomycetaceae bacterium]|nr:alcohol dehydrogenase catalytic domain-containing protein [Planctomycetaceae bacterium]
MKAVVLYADWEPKAGFSLGSKDVDGKLTYLGSKVWKNPRLKIIEKSKPQILDTEVLIEVKACGICGSDVHMAQPDDNNYILYPGLTAFPVTLGHEFAGVVVEAGKNAIDKDTGKPYKGGEKVCSEEMVWCSVCKPCADGYPNHCELLKEIGFSIDGAYTKYIAVDARYLWNLSQLEKMYSGDDIFLAGSLVEPTSVAYHAVIERGGGIRPGQNVVILGGGPIGMAAIAILKRAGAANVILSETQTERLEMGIKMGATATVNPAKEDFAQKVLKLTNGTGADLYLEATGLPHQVFGGIEECIWNGRTLNAVVVIVARADYKIPVTGEVFQVRRASIVGAQGHSGHGIFASVISTMASGMDMTPIITKKITLEQVPENIISLRTDRTECKITMVQ